LSIFGSRVVIGHNHLAKFSFPNAHAKIKNYAEDDEKSDCRRDVFQLKKKSDKNVKGLSDEVSTNCQVNAQLIFSGQ